MAIQQANFSDDACPSVGTAPLIIRDCTLREAEQAVGLTLHEKLRLAHELAAAGLQRIQLGAPGRSEIDCQAFLQLKDAGTTASLDALAIAYVPDWRDHIDACVACGADAVDIVHPVSEIHLREVLGVSPAGMLDRITDVVTYAKDRGVTTVAVSAMDAPRSTPEILATAARTAAAAGAQEFFICDSVGVAGPRWIGELTNDLVALDCLRVGVHCHNDLGLALANALAAVEAGCAIVDVTVNGIGERAGNVCLDELVVTLEKLYHLDTGVDTTKLTALATTMSDLTKVPLAFNKPLVGPHAFSHRHDTHARAAIAHPAAVEPLNPDFVGNQRRFLPGKYSGPFVIRQIADRSGLKLTDDQVDQLVELVCQVATESKTDITDSEFRRLAEEIIVQ